MERAEYLQLLSQHDDHSHWEYPGGWNKSAYDIAHRKFLGLTENIQQAFGEKLAVEYGSMIQDASFHGQVSLPQDWLLENYIISLRVSNFGSFATLYDADNVVKLDCLQKIKAILKQHDYIYLPSWILTEVYPDPKGVGIPNWGVRYFDYL